MMSSTILKGTGLMGFCPAYTSFRCTPTERWRWLVFV